ncbi:nodT family RND efflux system outer membrane lipoprotein [Anopheles sinensis]|uniref:NodT family RND efflux system outer membrane lipoprotein n=1 Tax=Anopheles sinensis TaxID=74873 RepID=A0A084VWB4_ANOSI|nr:nodT family RND efflux system outer membrane lipoprotein [Anopheles sinensis]
MSFQIVCTKRRITIDQSTGKINKHWFIVLPLVRYEIDIFLSNGPKTISVRKITFSLTTTWHGLPVANHPFITSLIV